MAPTRQEADEALDQLTYPNHPAGQPELDNYDAAISGYMDELEERLTEAGGTLPGEDEDDVIEAEAEPEGVSAGSEAETEGTAASTEGPSESTGQGGGAGEDIPTSTGPGGSAEGAPGV